MRLLSGMLCLILLISMRPLRAQLQVTPSTGMSPDALVKNVLIGQGVTVSNVKFNNSTNNISVAAIGTFQNGSTTNLGINGGIILTSGAATIAVGPNNSNSAGQSNNLPGDPQLALLIPGYTVNDASILEFDFVPESDTIEFRWVFGSDEYPEFVNTSFNDVFGFFLTGIEPVTWTPFTNRNIALIPSPPAPPNFPVTIDNVNSGSYPQFYVNNAGGQWIQYDGFTTVLTARAAVIPCLTYHIKIAVADAGDFIYDSGVFLEEGSFNSGGITVSTQFTAPGGGSTSFSTAVEGCSDALITFKFPDVLDDTVVLNISQIGGNAVNGVDYTWIPNTVVIPAGTDSGSIVIHPIADGISEGTETVMLIVPTGICSFITNEYDTHYVDIINYDPIVVHTIEDTTINCGDPIDLTAQYSGGIGPYLFSWTSDSTGVGLTDSVTITPTQTATYLIEVTDICDLPAYDSVEVIVNGIIVDAGPDTSICLGQSVDLLADGAATYQWSNGMSTAGITVAPATTTTYVVTGTQLCIGVDSVTVTVHPLPVIGITASADSICPGDSSTLSASGADGWVWVSVPPDPGLASQPGMPVVYLSPMVTTTYTAFGTDLNGCTSSDIFTLHVKPDPTSSFTVLDTLICEGEQTTVVYTGTSTAHATFQWDFVGGQASGTSPGPYLVTWDNPGLKEVKLVVTDQGCISPETMRAVDVQAHPDVAFEVFNPEGCPPLEVGFTNASAEVEPGASFHWTFGNGSESFQEDPIITYNKTGVYDVSLTITNPNGCQSKLEAPDLVHVYSVPAASFVHNPEFGTEFNPEINFYDRSLGNVVSWDWSTGDGSYYTDPDFMHRFPDTGTYTVMLTVVNDLGCVDTAVMEVVIKPDYTFYVPNAFTPGNADLLNNTFRVYGLNVKEFDLTIFDRWGGVAFQTNDPEEGWDGTINGSLAPVGIYVLVIYYTDVYGLRHSHYGHVSLLR